MLALVVALVAPRVIDGDTLEAGGVRYRVLDVDAPEIHGAKCVDERAAGLAAKRAVERWVARAGSITAEGSRLDRYGRTLARVRIDGEDLGERLVREGLARRWKPPAPRPQWCART